MDREVFAMQHALVRRSHPRQARRSVEALEPRFLMAAGDRDLSFGINGTATVSFPGSAFEARATALRPDGKTVLAGTKGGRVAVVRLNVDGSLDASFGGGGLFESTVATRATDVAVQADGKIVVTAIEPRVGGGADPNRFTILRVLAEGEGLDASFDGDGVVSRRYGTDSLGGYCYANAVAIQQDGKIVVAGQAYVDDLFSPGHDFVIARYNSDGSPDATFGTQVNGVPITWNWAGMGGSDEIIDLAIDYNGNPSTNSLYGSIVAVGNTAAYWAAGWVPQSSQFAVARFRPNGTLDGGFDGDGKLTTSFSGAQTSFAAGVLIQAGGKIVVAGSAGANAGPRDMALARFNANGSLDGSFGPNGTGKLLKELAGDDLVVDCAPSYATGFLVAASTGVAAFTPDGLIDLRFAGGATQVNASAGIVTTGAAVAPVRKLIVAGGSGASRLIDVGPRGALLAGITETHEANGPTLNIIVGTDRMPWDQRIYISIGGTAVAPVFSLPPNWDYSTTNINLPGFNVPRAYVDIPAGQTHTIFTVTPVNDTRVEGDETIELAVSPDAAYDIGNPSAYTLLIRDDDYFGAPVCNATAFQFETLPQQATFRFNQNVAAGISDGDFQITGPAGIPGHTFSYLPDTNTATLAFAAPLPDGNYTIRAPAGSITNASGQATTADAVLSFFVLAGDANRDRAVDIADFSILATRFNLPGTFSQGDFNYSGTTEIGDFAILAGRFNTSLPAARQAAAAGPWAAVPVDRSPAMADRAGAAGELLAELVP